MGYTKEQHAAYEAERYRRIKAEWTERLGGACVVCGSVENLEFDHIDPELKSFNVSRLWSVSKEKRDAEIEKCQLLCKEHHLEKSIREANAVPHGGGVSGKHGCKCDLCRLKKNEYLRNLKRERRARGLKD